MVMNLRGGKRRGTWDMALVMMSGAMSFIVCVLSLYRTWCRVDYVMELCQGGDLHTELQKSGPLEHTCMRYYAATLLDALEDMCKKRVVHRDIKPENVLLTGDGHIKLSDFGAAVLLTDEMTAATSEWQAEFTALLQDRKDKAESYASRQEEEDALMEGRMARGRRTSFVGTPEYVSPELLEGLGISYEADLWAYGLILYKMATGCLPFDSRTEYLRYKQIEAGRYTFPKHMRDDDARDLVSKLLQVDPSARIGAGGCYDDIRAHPFFARDGKSWEERLETVPPFVGLTVTEIADSEVDDTDDGGRDSDDEANGGPNLFVRGEVPPDLEEEEDSEQLSMHGRPYSIPGSEKRLQCKVALKDVKSMANTIGMCRGEPFDITPFVKEPYVDAAAGEVILAAGPIRKRKGLSIKSRVLIVTSWGRCFYCSPKDRAIMGCIVLDDRTSVVCSGKRSFELRGADRTYYMTDRADRVDNPESPWVPFFARVLCLIAPDDAEATKEGGRDVEDGGNGTKGE